MTSLIDRLTAASTVVDVPCETCDDEVSPDPTVDGGEALAAHPQMTGDHSHPHAAMGASGNDATHDHEHTHAGDAAHDHPHDPPAAETADAASTGAIPGFGRWATESFIRRDAGTGDGPVVAAAVVAGHLVEYGSPIGIASDAPEEGPWQVLTAAGAGWTVDTYADAVQRVAEEMAATADRPVLAERWRSVMAFEGVSTGDGRRIADGAIEYRPTPLPLMLQTVTEGGHFGAVLAGSIEETGKVGSRAVGAGCFFDFDAGRQFAQIIAGQGRFGVSIDVAESEGDFVCTDTNPDGECVDGEVVFSTVKIMGLCYDEKTEVLSEHGWTTFADLPRGVRVATRSKTGEMEWQEPIHYTNDEWDGPMIRFTGGATHRTLDLLVTPNHRMLVEETATGRQRFIPAEELARRSPRTFRFASVSQWSAPDVRTFRIEPPQVPEGLCACGCGEPVLPRTETLGPCVVADCDGPAYNDGLCNPHYQRRRRHGDPQAGGPRRTVRPNRHIDLAPKTLPGHGHGRNTDVLELDGDYFAALMGAWLAEGSLGTRGDVAISQQADSKGYPRYLQTFKHEDGWWHDGRKFHHKNIRLAAYLRQFGHARDKFVPEELKNFSTRQLWIFWDHYMAGDGSADGRKAYTCSPRLAGDIQEIAQKLGMWAVVGEQKSGGGMIDGRPIRSNGPQYVVAIRNRPGSRSAKGVWDWKAETVENYRGMVRCVTVPNESLYVRRNGIPAWCGNTGTPFPAFEGAYIEFDTADAAGQPVAAAATWAEAGNVTSVLTFSTTTNEAPALVAAGGPAFAPASAFDDPKLTGPTRLRVERLDGGLTRIYGHLATWDRCHTGYADRCVRPPRSPSGYAFFNDGPLPTSDGKIVHVGQITMGCGHADTNPRLSASAVKAHYDGGPGAKVVADVHVGEDRVGIWYSGVVRPDVTDEELRHFQATKRSGDWRNVERGKGIDLVAILGDVPVPGFPVHEPVAASAAPVEAVTARYVDGVLAVLVASFTVDEPEAWQVAIAERDDVIADMRDRLAAVERIAGPLRPIAAAAIIDAAVGADL